MPPIALSDAELKIVMQLAQPIARALRGQFLRAVAAELQQQQQQGHGDGAAHRVARSIQRKFLSASVPLSALRAARGKYG
jgi:hypothetical protein